jgi:RHS repeat-associated protein
MMPPRNNDISRHTILLASSKSQSILAEVSRGEASVVSYSAYGHLLSDHLLSTRLGFNGELREPHKGWYMLGNGYRAYNPVLMRFHSPDKLSPFGAGGLNAYMYCVGDPINYRDPTGHLAISVMLTQFAGVSGGASSVGGMLSSLLSSGRFSGQGIGALGSGAAGVLLGAVAITNPGSLLAPVVASGAMTAGAASFTLAYRATRAATARGNQWFRPLARVDSLPRYSDVVKNPPSYDDALRNAPPPYTPSSSQLTAPPTHSTAATALSQTASPNHPQLLTVPMGDLPQVEVINEIKTAADKIRSTNARQQSLNF